MSEVEDDRGHSESAVPRPHEDVESDEPTPTPFDHPLFLPVILAGLSLWFFWDGFINQDPDMLEHLTFNRGGFVLLAAATLWSGYRGLREMRELREEEQRREREDVEPGPPPA